MTNKWGEKNKKTKKSNHSIFVVVESRMALDKKKRWKDEKKN